MKKALMIASEASMLDNFNRNNIKLLLSMGYAVTLAADFSSMEDSSPRQHIEKFEKDMYELGCNIVQIDFSRQILNIKKQYRSYKQVKKLVNEKYDLVHCNSPICAALTRLAFRNARKGGTKIIYMAHGFHFCNGAPLKNWVFFFSAEWICSWWTDVLITINEEDYVRAQKHMHAKIVKYVPGVGIDLKKYAPRVMNEEEKHRKRRELGVRDGEKLLLSVGELSRDKNHILVLEALKREPSLDYRYVVCGRGAYMDKYKKFIKKNKLEDRVQMLGFRSDISEILQITDLFVFPSTFEGLPVALMEAIASKVMVVCSASRGNTDLVKDEKCMFDYRSVNGLIQTIQSVENIGVEEKSRILEDNYSRLLSREKSKIIAAMREIYMGTGNFQDK